MMNFLKFAWSKRDQWWTKRDVAATMAGRYMIRLTYHFAGWLSAFIKTADSSHAHKPKLKKAANPFIEYEIGRLRIKSAPIVTTMRESYAQCNEDIIVEGLLKAIFARTNRALSTARYLEIGGNHPVQTSSTYLLYRAWGAKGHIIEANAGLAERLRTIRPNDQVIQTAVSDRFDKTVSFHVHELDELSSLSQESMLNPELAGAYGKLARVETVANLHINDFFDRHIREPLDFMSIDIEGLDLPVLLALSPIHRPTVLQVECMDATLLTELTQALEPRGYQLAAITEVNVIFVQKHRSTD